MPIFNEFNITKTSDIAWDGGKPTENLIPNDGDVVFDPTGGGGRSTVMLPYIEQHGEEADDGGSFDLVFPTQTAFPEVSGLKIEHDVIEFSPDQAVNIIAIIAPTDLNEVDVGHADLLFSESAPGGAGCSVDICAQNSPPASPEPVTYAGWGPWEVNTGYANPSSFQIISAGKDEAGSRTAHSGSSQWVMGDGSVRLADASDLFVNFDGNSQPIGDQNSPPPATHTGGHFELVLDGHSSSHLSSTI